MELLRDRRSGLETAGVRAFGVSRDSPWTHIAWKQALDLDFPLLSDWNAEATEGFGIAREFKGMRGVPERAAFLIGQDGTVRGRWRYDDSELPNFDELVRAAQALSD
ncbi:MAG: redoxin domain-containing protein [Actinobacteria bacterium]|nr:redoxin domain-containing protein [Actinomycetota bacterium]